MMISMTLDEAIAELQKLRSRLLGDTPVELYDFDGGAVDLASIAIWCDLEGRPRLVMSPEDITSELL
jgi:hypothetical protein